MRSFVTLFGFYSVVGHYAPNFGYQTWLQGGNPLSGRRFSDMLEVIHAHALFSDNCPVNTPNAESDVTWVHSYVTPDRTSTFCIYDAPNPEAIRHAGERNGLPVDSVTEVRVLDPYFYR